MCYYGISDYNSQYQKTKKPILLKNDRLIRASREFETGIEHGEEVAPARADHACPCPIYAGAFTESAGKPRRAGGFTPFATKNEH